MEHDATRNTLSATSLVGDGVRNPADESLGDIKELMVDLATGRIAYAVLDASAWYEVGNRLFAVPFGAMRLDTDRKEFVLDIDRERLRNAPGFDPDDWPDFTDREWGSQVHSHYDVDPYWLS